LSRVYIFLSSAAAANENENGLAAERWIGQLPREHGELLCVHLFSFFVRAAACLPDN